MIRRLAELLGFSLLAWVVLAAVLVGGQAVKVGDLLFGPAGPAPGWPRALGLAALVLLEAALPLVALVASGLVYGRQRAEGAGLAWSALGASPLRRYAPAALLGVGLGLAAGWLAQGPVPRAVRELGGVLQGAAAHQLAAAEGTVALPGGGVARRGGGQVWAVLPTPSGPDGPARRRAGAARGRRVHLARGARPRLAVGPRACASARGRRSSTSTTRRCGGGWACSGRRTIDPRPSCRRRPTAASPGIAAARCRPWRPPGRCWARCSGPASAPRAPSRARAPAVAAAYWLLRVGELSARAGFMAPWLAAWAPALVLALALAWAATRGAFD
ncbi:MAG: LptF/LptG family permease [Myxococcales bacterium]|nr:LptF/LptG family permease [Myxococcales bacterium]